MDGDCFIFLAVTEPTELWIPVDQTSLFKASHYLHLAQRDLAAKYQIQSLVKFLFLLTVKMSVIFIFWKPLFTHAATSCGKERHDFHLDDT